MRMTAPCGSERSTAIGPAHRRLEGLGHLGAGEVEEVAGHPGLDPRPRLEPQPSSSGRASSAMRPAASTGSLGGVDLLHRIGELVGDVAGHLLGDPLVVALEEDEPDHELQRHDRNQ